MSILAVDLILSGITYVIITYLAFRLMKKSRRSEGGDDGNMIDFSAPIIDLPPGICWPSDAPAEKKKSEVV